MLIDRDHAIGRDRVNAPSASSAPRCSAACSRSPCTHGGCAWTRPLIPMALDGHDQHRRKESTMQHQLTLPPPGDGIEAIPAEDLATEYPELGYWGRYHSVYLEDCGSTRPVLQPLRSPTRARHQPTRGDRRSLVRRGRRADRTAAGSQAGHDLHVQADGGVP